MPTKRCNGCNKDRDIEDFNLKDRTKGTLQALCRFCIAEYGRGHYKNNKQAYIETATAEKPSSGGIGSDLSKVEKLQDRFMSPLKNEYATLTLKTPPS